MKSIKIVGEDSANLDSAVGKCFSGILICCPPLSEFLQDSYGSYCFCSPQLVRKEKETWNPMEGVQFLGTVALQLTNCLCFTHEFCSLKMILQQ